MILNNAWSLLFRWLAQQQGSAHFPHLAMAYPKCVHSQCVGDVALVTEQQTNTNTVMPPQAGLGYQSVSVQLFIRCYPCFAGH